MLYHLLSARTGFRDTDLLITTICKGVVETGLATTTIVILDAIFFFRLVCPLFHRDSYPNTDWIHPQRSIVYDEHASLRRHDCGKGDSV